MAPIFTGVARAIGGFAFKAAAGDTGPGEVATGGTKYTYESPTGTYIVHAFTEPDNFIGSSCNFK